MKRTQLLLGIIFVMSLLFGCQDDGAGASPDGDDESVTSPEATSDVTESDDEIGTAENEADEVPDAPRATATAIPFTRGAEETAAFPSDVAGKQADDIGNLTVALTTPTNATPLAEAEVFIFSEGLMVYEGKTSSSVFRQTLPLGSYDIAIKYGSTPPIGYLQKDIEVGSTAAEVVEFVVPDEGKLTVSLATENGTIPGKPFSVSLRIDEKNLGSNQVRGRDEGMTVLNLRSDLTYDVVINYDGLVLVQEDIRVRSEEESISFTLPFVENNVEIFLRQDDEPLPSNAEITLLDSNGSILVDKEMVKDSLVVLLRLDEEYTMYINYGDAFTQVETITVTELGLVQLVIEVED